MPSSLALFSVQAYVSAGLYVQARGLSSPAAEMPTWTPEERSYPPSVFFGPEATPARPFDDSPYRSSLPVRFAQKTLPQGVVDYLINRSYLTGLYFSLFRHGPASAPEGYEVREGSALDCDRSILGGEAYDAQEEIFFDVAWVAHVHPPHKSPLPSDADLEALSARARLGGTRHARHVLFGFQDDEPVCVDMRAVWDPVFRGLALLHRASPAISRRADARIQEWLDKPTSSGL